MRYLFVSAALALFFVPALVGCNDSAEPVAEETPAVDTVEATPVNFANEKCPIMGGEPTPELTAQYKGKTIGFCCEGCPEKWAELSEEEKAEKFAEVKDGSDGEADSHDHEGHEHEDHEAGDEAETQQ